MASPPSRATSPLALAAKLSIFGRKLVAWPINGVLPVYPTAYRSPALVLAAALSIVRAIPARPGSWSICSPIGIRPPGRSHRFRPRLPPSPAPRQALPAQPHRPLSAGGWRPRIDSHRSLIALRVSGARAALGQVGTEARARSQCRPCLWAAGRLRRAPRARPRVPLAFWRRCSARFGASQPRAFVMIISPANPLTLQDCSSACMRRVLPRRTAAHAVCWTRSAPNWARCSRSGVRHPFRQPSERWPPQQRLEAGQVEVALAEVMRIPGHDNAADWIQKARIYVAARGALDTIETAALLEPRAAPAPQPRPVAPAPPGRGPG